MRALLLACILAASACAARPAPRAGQLPALLLEGERGRRVSLAAHAAGRPLVVELFTTWCKACPESMRSVDALARELAGTDLLVVGVAPGESWARAAALAGRLGLAYPVLGDPDFAYSDALGESRVPRVLVVDRKGRIVHDSPRLDAATRAAVHRALAAW